MNVSKLRQHDKEIVKRYLDGESARNIACSLKSFDSSISYRLKLNGIKKRSISEANVGRPKSIEHRKNLSKNRIDSGVAEGSRNPNWKGGIQDEWSELKNSSKYKSWRKEVYERDKYTCKGCGYAGGSILEAHHILSRSKFPHLTFNVGNGLTLCKHCHKKVHSSIGANLQLGELRENPTVKSGIIRSRALYIEKVQRLCTQPERDEIVWSMQ